MRFREARETDVHRIAAAFAGYNALPLEPRVREALPDLLRQVIASPAGTLWVFEDPREPGNRVVSVAGGLFLRDEFIDAYLAAPYPGLWSAALARMLDGDRPLCTLEEIRRANASGGLPLAVLSMPLGTLPWDGPTMVTLRTLAQQAFLRSYAGYRLRAIYYEVFADVVAEYLRAGGYRLLHDFSARAGSGFLPPDCRPRMMRLTRDDLPPGAMSMATQMFDPPAPEVGLTPAEQRIVVQAMDGASDRALAESLGLSDETVRSNWRSIYRRLGDERLGIVAAATTDGRTRGVEKRRLAIEYLRQNMHELRPYGKSGNGVSPGRRG